MSPVLGTDLQKARDLVGSGNFEEGLSLYSILVREFPQADGEYGRAAAMSGDFDLAHRIWERLRHREQRNARVLSWLAVEYANWGMHIKARALTSEAASLEPQNLNFQVSLAWVLSRTSSVQEARPVVNKCLELDPHNEAARFFSALLDRREDNYMEAERKCRDLLASCPQVPRVRYACHAELAFILDRAERFDEAVVQLQQGKALAGEDARHHAIRKAFFARVENTIRRVRALPKDILCTWNKAFPANERVAAPTLAFLSGSSRSGTTLLERVLDAHPAVSACDESLLFDNLQRRMEFTAPEISAQRINVFRQLYLQGLTTMLGPSSQHKTLLDKNPANTHWLPAFLRVFPEMRVVIALRDPRDVLLSMYFQDHPMTHFLGLEELVETYTPVMDVWVAIREWDGLDWIETRYEDTVADLEKEGRRVTQFLSLEWNENQTRYYERNREKPVMSNNYSDVTKPVYKRAAGRWRNYEKLLAPILSRLEPYCRMFGYS